MTDLTSTISSMLVETHKCDPIDPHYSFKTLDSFLLEAKHINKSISDLLLYLRAIRSPYLSTGPPPRRNQNHTRVPSATQTPLGNVPSYITDSQRKDIDTSTSAIVRDVTGNINNLQSATTLRHETAQRRLEQKYGKSTNFLLRWAAGGDGADVGNAGKTAERIKEEGQEETIHAFRQSVVSYLGMWLKKAANAQQEMLMKRVEREEEKKASILYDERNKNVKSQRPMEESIHSDGGLSNLDTRGRDTYNPALDPYGSSTAGQELSPEQLQLFEEENSSLMNHYNETLTQVTQAEKSLLEISELQSTLAGHLEVQGEVIGGLVADADRTEENVNRGNKELKRATERTRFPRVMFHVTCYLCGGLILWDLVF